MTDDVVPIPFTPPHVSLNRVRIVDLPGLPLDDEVRGRTAYDLLSSAAVIRYALASAALANAEALGVPQVVGQTTPPPPFWLTRVVSDSLDSPDERARAAARDIARRLGRNLACVLLTLHRGDRINREARPDWAADDWERWAAIRQVWLGGGLMNGLLGQFMAQAARDLLAEWGYAGQLPVQVSPYGDLLAVLGAGRYLPATAQCALALDSGQSSVKRVCLELEGGALVRVHRFSSQRPDVNRMSADAEPGQAAYTMLDLVARAIARTFEEAVGQGLSPGEDVMLSVAGYVQDGRILTGQYTCLCTNEAGRPASDARPLISKAVQERTGRAFRVHLIHDGTAAAAVYAGHPNTAVIMLGTALGIGFAPASDSGLRKLALSASP